MTPDKIGKATAKATARFTAELAARAKSLEMLYDYTKFHIGIYLTLTASYITVATVKVADAAGKQYQFLPANQYLMTVAVLSFMLAGLAGGIIVSSITQRVGGSSNDFLETEIGPWNAKCIRLRGRTWTYIEHTSFWVGLIAAVISFVVLRA